MVALCGVVEISEKEQVEFGLAFATQISPDISNLQEAMDSANDNLVNAAYDFCQNGKELKLSA